MLNVDLAEPGQWELVYQRQLSGDIRKWQQRPKIPAIDPLELPVLFDSRIFLVSAVNVSKTWVRAGYLYYEVQGLGVDDRATFTDFPGSPTTSADASTRMIKLNSLELIIFPRLSAQLRLRFEPIPWLDKLTFAIWEYKGQESDSTVDLIQAVRAQVTTLDFKVDQLLQR